MTFMMRIVLAFPAALFLTVGCDPSGEPADEVLQADDLSEEADSANEADLVDPSLTRVTNPTPETPLSEVAGCHFYVNSYYGGTTLWMPRNSTLYSLHEKGMGDKISSVRLRGGASTRMWIHSNYGGSSWLISSDVPTLHVADPWKNLGDNASSADCY